MTQVLVAVLLAAATALSALAAVGMVAVRDPFDRLHYTSPPALAGILAAVAVLLELGPTIATAKAILLAVLLAVTSPVALQMLARATRANLRGTVAPHDEVRAESRR